MLIGRLREGKELTIGHSSADECRRLGLNLSPMILVISRQMRRDDEHPSKPLWCSFWMRQGILSVDQFSPRWGESYRAPREWYSMNGSEVTDYLGMGLNTEHIGTDKLLSSLRAFEDFVFEKVALWWLQTHATMEYWWPTNDITTEQHLDRNQYWSIVYRTERCICHSSWNPVGTMLQQRRWPWSLRTTPNVSPPKSPITGFVEVSYEIPES